MIGSLDLLEKLITEKRTQKTKRSLKLLADFSAGYARNWYFCIPTFFYDALDIQFTERADNKKKIKIFTQGSYFNFSPGDMIYNHPYAYCDNFVCSLSIPQLILQIESSTPVSLQIKDEKNNIDKNRDPGSVNFKFVQYPTNWQGNLNQSLSQDDFIYFLITGKIRLNDSGRGTL